MSDLHGEDAFERVLDRLVEAEKRASTSEERNRGGAHQVQLLQNELNNARSDLTSTKLKLDAFEKGEDAIVKLYDAAEDAVGVMLAAIPSCQSTGAAADLLSRSETLRSAVIAARTFIDPIPF